MIIINTVKAENKASIELQNRIAKINNYYGFFIQKIFDVSDETVAEGTGEIWMKRPNLFHWHIITPEENFLISDGKTIWFYIPAIKQVIAYWLKDISDNILLSIFGVNNISIWDNYDVSQKLDDFTLTPKWNNSDLKKYSIIITNDGIINQINIFEENGQNINYFLLRQSNEVTANKDKFCFSLSQDIQLDDQRK